MSPRRPVGGQERVPEFSPDDPKPHIYHLYDLTIGASIAFLPTTFIGLISLKKSPELSAAAICIAGIVLLWEWWLNRFYGTRHSAVFEKRIITGCYFILNNLFVLVLVLLPAMLALGDTGILGWSVFQPFALALITLNLFDGAMDLCHFFFNKDRPKETSVVHFFIDLTCAGFYGLWLCVIKTSDFEAALWLMGFVVSEISWSLLAWFILEPRIKRWVEADRKQKQRKARKEATRGAG